MKKIICFITLGLSLATYAQDIEKKSKVNKDLKYETIWSLYDGKKLTVMPKYNVEEAESYSTFTVKENSKTIIISSSSPNGDVEIVVRITGVIREGNIVTYTGTGSNGKMIIKINILTKWIEVTNIQDGKSFYEYHKLK